MSARRSFTLGKSQRNHPFVQAACAATLIGVLAGCGGPGDQSSKIQGQTGATDCTEASYAIKSRLDGSEQRIYNCNLNGATVCVVEEGGIAKDVTAEARILFANALGDQKPACVS